MNSLVGGQLHWKSEDDNGSGGQRRNNWMSMERV